MSFLVFFVFYGYIISKTESTTTMLPTIEPTFMPSILNTMNNNSDNNNLFKNLINFIHDRTETIEGLILLSGIIIFMILFCCLCLVFYCVYRNRKVSNELKRIKQQNEQQQLKQQNNILPINTNINVNNEINTNKQLSNKYMIPIPLSESAKSSVISNSDNNSKATPKSIILQTTKGHTPTTGGAIDDNNLYKNNNINTDDDNSYNDTNKLTSNNLPSLPPMNENNKSISSENININIANNVGLPKPSFNE
mmetsp:Transcript_49054/g.60288  ORF Transcript_49054/g.60288 Transcript_49054/m.60288 type:complete len:251 (+) Transcript_49054:24-776(+)